MDREVKRYLRTGKHDHEFTGWPGGDFLTCLTNGKQTMEDALLANLHSSNATREPGWAVDDLGHACTSSEKRSSRRAKRRGVVMGTGGINARN